MSLKDRLKPIQKSLESKKTDENELPSRTEIIDFSSLKEQLYALLSKKIQSIPIWINYSKQQQNEMIKQFVENQLSNAFKHIHLDKNEKNQLLKEITQDSGGYGPLNQLLEDSDVSEILVNGKNKIYTVNNGELNKTSLTFKDNQHLKNITERIVLETGMKSDKLLPELSGIFNAKLADGSHVNAIFPPIAVDGPYLSIKKSMRNNENFSSLLKKGFLTKEIEETLCSAVKAGLNIIVIGMPDSGKTDLLNSLASQIPNEERIITIEDFQELSLKQENVVRLETQSAMIGQNAVTTKDLVVHALKMRPNRIIIGECSGSEVFDIIQVANTKIKCFLTSICASSMADALSKLETMFLSSGINMSENAVKSHIVSAIDLIILVESQNGIKKITSVSEIVGMRENAINTQEIFNLKSGDPAVKILEQHTSTGIKPKFLEKLEKEGLSIPLTYFNKERKHTYSIEKTAESRRIKNRLVQTKKV